MTAALAASQLVKEYAGARALGPLDLAIEPGEVVALVGHNGAGKSTLLGLAAGLLDRSSGELTVCGERPGSLPARRVVSFVPDTPVLYEDLGVGELVEYVARLHDPTGWRDRAAAAVARLDLGGRVDQLPGQLSRGLRQRLAVPVRARNAAEIGALAGTIAGQEEAGIGRLRKGWCCGDDDEHEAGR